MAAALARKLLSPSSVSRLPALSRHLSSSSSLLRNRSPALSELLRPAASSSSSSLVLRIETTRGMARRPGGDEYSPMRGGGGGGGDRAPTQMAPLFPGCDYEHWLIVMDKPGGEGATKQQMIDCYIQTLAKVLGSEEEAKKKIYNVGTLDSGVRLTRRYQTSSKGFLVFSLCFRIPMLTLSTRTTELSCSRMARLLTDLQKGRGG